MADLVDVHPLLAQAGPRAGGHGAEPGGTGRPAWRRAAGYLARRPGLVLAGLVLALVVAWALAPHLFTARDPLAAVPRLRLRPPSAAHPFGTDQLGRDLYARVVYGASLSLRATLVAVLVAAGIGATLGLVAGFAGRWVDDALMRLVDVLLAIPGLLLSLAVVTALGFGTAHVAIAVGLATAANFARVTRAEVLRVRQAVYVEAAHATGTRWYAILLRHVLPNASGPVLVMAALEFGTAILSVSSLSFLGFGAAPPAPEWGALVADGRNYVAVAWWLTVLPGLTVAATVLAANRVSRALEGGLVEGVVG